MADEIAYKTGMIPDIELVIALYIAAGLKRPVEDKERMKKMFLNSNLVVTAWHQDVLIGISRAMTDYGYWSYLADLAVHPDYQKRGIGRKLIAETKIRAGNDCTLLLLAAPSALSYYRQVGFRNLTNAFAADRKI